MKSNDFLNEIFHIFSYIVLQSKFEYFHLRKKVHNQCSAAQFTYRAIFSFSTVIVLSNIGRGSPVLQCIELITKYFHMVDSEEIVTYCTLDSHTLIFPFRCWIMNNDMYCLTFTSNWYILHLFVLQNSIFVLNCFVLFRSVFIVLLHPSFVLCSFSKFVSFHENLTLYFDCAIFDLW